MNSMEYWDYTVEMECIQDNPSPTGLCFSHVFIHANVRCKDSYFKERAFVKNYQNKDKEKGKVS